MKDMSPNALKYCQKLFEADIPTHRVRKAFLKEFNIPGVADKMFYIQLNLVYPSMCLIKA